MKNCPDATEKQSRRTFTKSITSALVAVPLISSSVRADHAFATKHVSAPLNPRFASAPTNFVLTHIPPLIIRSGSLIIESLAELKKEFVRGEDRRFKYVQNPNMCAYGAMMGVNINDGRGKCLNPGSVMSKGEWAVTVLLRKFNGYGPSGPIYVPGPVPESQKVVVTNKKLAPEDGFFKIEIHNDIGKRETVSMYNQYYEKYKLSEFDKSRFRIVQVTVEPPSGASESFPQKLEEVNELAELGFEISVLFDHPAVGDKCLGIRREDVRPTRRSFWERLRRFFKGR